MHLHAPFLLLLSFCAVGMSLGGPLRYSRGVPLASWKAIMSTSLGSKLSKLNGNTEKVYFKKGSFFEASKDFYQLGPQRVRVANDGNVMIGTRGNQVFTLKNSNEGPLRATLRIAEDVNTANMKGKTIIYLNHPSVADDALRQWQDEAIKP